MKIRSSIADALASLIHYVNQFHIWVHKLLERLERGNITVWGKIVLRLVRIYARILPPPPRKEDDAAKDEDEDRRIL